MLGRTSPLFILWLALCGCGRTLTPHPGVASGPTPPAAPAADVPDAVKYAGRTISCDPADAGTSHGPTAMNQISARAREVQSVTIEMKGDKSTIKMGYADGASATVTPGQRRTEAEFRPGQ
jgi:hypothetical protein